MLQIDIDIHFENQPFCNLAASVVLVLHGVNPSEPIRLNDDADYGDETS
jgi:hypothetical protein